MDYQLQLSLWFSLGVVLESFFLLWRKFNRGKIFILVLCVLIPLFIMVYLYFRNSFTVLPTTVAAGALWYAFFFSVGFKSEILPKISEQTILSFNLLLWYVMAVYLFPRIGYDPTLITIVSILTLLTLITAFFEFKLPAVVQAFFYTWFLVMIVALTVSQISFGTIAVLLAEEKEVIASGFFDAILNGMVFLYLVANFWYIIEFFPIPGENQSLSDRLHQWQEHVALLADKFSDRQLKHFEALFIVVFVGGVLALNYFYHFIANSILISLTIIVIPQLISLVLNKKYENKN